MDYQNKSGNDGGQKTIAQAPPLTRSGFERSYGGWVGRLILSEDKFNSSHRVFENIVIVFYADELDESLLIIFI